MSTDVFTKEKRSEIMGRVKSKNTKPEKSVRSMLHKMGYRFRLHRKDLPGNPDIVLPKYKIAVFVHGCFWHQHPGCRKATVPVQNFDFWDKKLKRNQERDSRVKSELSTLGWLTVTVWECEVKAKNWEALGTTLDATIKTGGAGSQRFIRPDYKKE